MRLSTVHWVACFANTRVHIHLVALPNKNIEPVFASRLSLHLFSVLRGVEILVKMRATLDTICFQGCLRKHPCKAEPSVQSAFELAKYQLHVLFCERVEDGLHILVGDFKLLVRIPCRNTHPPVVFLPLRHHFDREVIVGAFSNASPVAEVCLGACSHA